MSIGSTTRPKPASSRGWHLLGGLIVAGWLATLGVMFIEGDRSGGAIRLSAADLPGALVEDEGWMGVYHNGRKVGYVHTRTRKVEGGLRMEQEGRLTVRLGGVRQHIDSRLSVMLRDGYLLQSFGFEMDAGVVKSRVEGRMTGGKLAVEVDLGGEVQKRTWSLEESPMFDLALPRVLARRDLRAGDKFQVTVFDPRSMSNQPSLIEVVGRDAVQAQGGLRSAIQLKRTTLGQTLRTWIDDRGEVLKEESELGLSFRREDEASARAEGGTEGPGTDDLLQSLLPPPPPHRGATEDRADDPD